MAAHAIDEVVEIEEKIEVVEMDATEPEGGATYESKGFPFSIPPPLPWVSINTYSQVSPFSRAWLFYLVVIVNFLFFLVLGNRA